MLFIAICALFGPQIIPPSQSGDFVVDAYFSEWQNMARFHFEAVGTGKIDGRADLSGYAQIGFDANDVFFAVDIVDDRFVPGGAAEGDRLFLRFSDASEAVQIQVILNTLEVRPPTISIDGGYCKQCKAAGTLRRNGWAVEFSIPHTHLPGFDRSAQTLIATVHDTDARGEIADGTVSTGTARTVGAPFDLDTAANARAAYLEAKRTETPVIGRLRADVWGNGLTEEIYINGKDVVILGQDLPEDAAYLYFSHDWRPEAKILRIRARELDGRPGKEILVYRVVRPRQNDTRVEVVDVYGIHKGYLRRRFSQVVGIDLGAGRSARSSLTIRKKGKKPAVFVVEPASVEGLTQETFRDPDPGQTVDAHPLPLPWAAKRQRYRLRGVNWAP